MEPFDQIQSAAKDALARGDVANARSLYQTLAATFTEQKAAILTAARGLRTCGDAQAAVAVLEAALPRFSDSPALLDEVANAYTELGGGQEVTRLRRLIRVLELKIVAEPRNAMLWDQLGATYRRLGHAAQSEAALAHAVQASSGDEKLVLRLAIAQLESGRGAKAQTTLAHLLSRNSTNVDALSIAERIRTPTVADVSKLALEAWTADSKSLLAVARAKYEEILRSKPEHLFALTRLLTFDGLEGRLADANDHARQLQEELARTNLDDVDREVLTGLAYQTVLWPLPNDLYKAITSALGRKLSAIAGPPRRTTPHAADGRRLKIGYLSALFRNHPVGQVMANLFGAHDRTHFDVHVFYLAGERHTKNRYTDIIATSVEHFITLPKAANAAEVVAACDLDLLIYIDGYMTPDLLPVVASRPAPVQVFWLGHAGGCEVSGIDYLLADDTVVRQDEEQLFAAKIERLPHTFYCASSHPIGQATDRVETGLPEGAFVFCNFNNPEKFEHLVFDSWMRILSRAKGSVLWLSEFENPAIADNLRMSAMTRGIDPARLIFAKKLPDKASHLARHRYAGLLLDTFTLNAATVALDALWSGLPVLTVEGAHFGSRLAATALRTLSLSDMITRDPETYENRAVHLATHPEELDDIRGRLETGRYESPLFKIDQFCRDLEGRLAAIHRRHAPAS